MTARPLAELGRLERALDPGKEENWPEQRPLLVSLYDRCWARRGPACGLCCQISCDPGRRPPGVA